MLDTSQYQSQTDKKRAVDVSLLSCQIKLPTVHHLFQKFLPIYLVVKKKKLSIMFNKSSFRLLYNRFYHSILTYNFEFRESNLPAEHQIYLYISFYLKNIQVNYVNTHKNTSNAIVSNYISRSYALKFEMLFENMYSKLYCLV